MTPHRTAVVLLGVCMLLIVALWAWSTAPRETAPAATPARAPAASASASNTMPEPGTNTASAVAPVPTEAAREAVPAPAIATVGSLLVRVVYSDDKSPAAGIDVELHRGGTDTLFDTARGRTDAAGAVRFADLAPGRVFAQVERGESHGGQRIEIVAGEPREVTLTLTMGMNAAGLVVDSRLAPVADAAIVVSGWGGGTTTTVEHSAPDGTFRLRAMPTHCHIGARKAGFRPSSLRQFTAGDGAEVAFTIVLEDDGGELAGLVLDPQGQPVADAVVRAGDMEQNNHKLPDGANAMGPQSEQVRTDAGGRFHFASVVPGQVPLAVRARGLAPWQQRVEVKAGRREQLTIHLAAGVTLVGTVHDAAGRPLAKVDVDAGEWGDLGRRTVRTADDGSFRIEGLGTERLRVRIQDETHGKAQTDIQGAPGQTVFWHAVLSSGLQLRGRVVDSKGAGLPSVMVEGMLERAPRGDQARGDPDRGDHWYAFENTDDQGRFAFKNCREGRTIRISLRRVSVFHEKVITAVVPGAEEFVIELPDAAWVHIQGTVLDPDGKPLPNVHATPTKKDSGGGSPAETVDAQTGAFRYGPYPAGDYQLHLQSDGLPAIRLPWRTIAANEVWDVGTLRFQRGGIAVVQLMQTTGPTLPELRLAIHDADGARTEFCQVEAGTGRSPPLLPGTYHLQVDGAGLACRQQPFEIRADAVTQIDVHVQAGIRMEIEFAAADEAKATHLDTVIRDAQGRVVLRREVWRHEGRLWLVAALAPGSYTAEAMGEGARGTGTFAVVSPGPCTTVVQVAPQ